MRNKPEYYVVGVDFGHKRDAWAVVFGGVGFDNAYIEVYDEFVHNNYNEVRNYTINELIDKTVEKIIT